MVASEDAAQYLAPDVTPDAAADLWLDDDAGPVVRPYAMTQGRTRPTAGEFDLIALVVATQPVSAALVGLGPEHTVILTLCQHPLSVAEISAHLDLPVGTVRVLLGDLLAKGLVLARDPKPVAQLHSQRVLKAVINGLRSL
jgi:DNA-directed RNA polymerase specialized sigma24 family protein